MVVHAHFLFWKFLRRIVAKMIAGMPKFPGEDFVNSFYPILFALVLGLVLGFRFVFQNIDSFRGHCTNLWNTGRKCALWVCPLRRTLSHYHKTCVSQINLCKPIATGFFWRNYMVTYSQISDLTYVDQLPKMYKV